MKTNEFCELMERIAPPACAMEWDHIGLLIGPDRKEIKKVLVALDLTINVAEEAVQGGYDLVLTHHPIFWNPVGGMYPDRFETAAAYRLVRNGIGLYAAHTNLDAAEGGVNDVFADLLGLHSIRPLPPEQLGRVGILKEAMPLSSFVRLCEEKLHTKARVVGDPDRIVQTVCCIGGAGGSDVEAVFEAGCDVFVTGEMKHSQALQAEYLGLSCFVLGHYETEVIVLKPLIDRLQREKNDVQYNLTQTGRVPMPCSEGGTRNE